MAWISPRNNRKFKQHVLAEYDKRMTAATADRTANMEKAASALLAGTKNSVHRSVYEAKVQRMTDKVNGLLTQEAALNKYQRRMAVAKAKLDHGIRPGPFERLRLRRDQKKYQTLLAGYNESRKALAADVKEQVKNGVLTVEDRENPTDPMLAFHKAVQETVKDIKVPAGKIIGKEVRQELIDADYLDENDITVHETPADKRHERKKENEILQQLLSFEEDDERLEAWEYELSDDGEENVLYDEDGIPYAPLSESGPYLDEEETELSDVPPPSAVTRRAIDPAKLALRKETKTEPARHYREAELMRQKEAQKERTEPEKDM